MKKVKKITAAILLAFALLVTLVTVNYTFSTRASADTVSAAELKAYNLSVQHDQEIKSYARIPTIDEDFDDNEITVILDGEHSGTGIGNSVYNIDIVTEELGKVDNIKTDSIEELFKTEENETVAPTYRRMLSVKLKTPGKDKVIEAISKLKSSDIVLAAEPKYNFEVRDQWAPSDTDYTSQWGLHGTYGIDAESAWDISRGRNVKVGLMEKGIDYNHEDLAGRVTDANFNLATATDLAHGTHVGGIIAAVADNNIGIAGVSQATLSLLNSDAPNFASSLDYALNNGIKIINASFGYELNDGTYVQPIAEHRQAIENYGAKGGLLICVAGNDNNNNDTNAVYPAGYGDSRLFPTITNVISVGAINSNCSRKSDSNYGENSVHIYAPGDDIISAYPAEMCDNGTHGKGHVARGYHRLGGTSMAAPHVTGAAALLLSYDQSLTGTEIKKILLDSAETITIKGKTAKLLNAANAINSIFDPNRIGLQYEGSEGGGWNIQVTNHQNTSMKIYYNTKMCFEGDAKAWTGLSDVDHITLSAGASQTVKVLGNGAATHIAFSFVSGGTRYITYANKLDNYNWLIPDTATVSYHSYTKYGMTVSIAGKNGNTWLIELTNNTGNTQQFAYNTKLCYAGDAQKWSGLTDIYFITLANGETTSAPLEITENYSATSIAISYIEGINRRIFYAYDLNTSGTMSAFESSVNISAPPDECVAAGTLITLADGTQKAVEDLTGDELLLVWNMETGSFDSAPIMFIDSDLIGHYEVISLEFSDGTTVDVIAEHGFWNVDLNEYVYLDANAAQYIGHRFNKQTVNADGTMGWTEVTLTDVEISTEVTTAYSPVTYGHLCYYVNGMLSMPGGITGLFNIFEIDEDTMTIDADDYLEDVEEYGLFTYEEFYEMYPVSEDVFNAFGGKYLKISVGKGLIDYETIGALIERYSEFF